MLLFELFIENIKYHTSNEVSLSGRAFTNFDRFQPINWTNINILESGQDKLYMEGKPNLHNLCDQQLNICSNVDSVAKRPPKLNKIANI